MEKKRNAGKIFEESFENSAKKENRFVFRVRDVNPMALKSGFRVARNPYDTILYNRGHLFPIELKSTQTKSISISGKNPQIKPHQIESLSKAGEYEGVIAGVVLNFREYDNQTFFIPIDELNTYIKYATSQKPHPYKVREGKKLNKSSISLDICQEIGVEVMNVVKRVRYHYFITHMTDELISKYGYKH